MSRDLDANILKNTDSIDTLNQRIVGLVYDKRQKEFFFLLQTAELNYFIHNNQRINTMITYMNEKNEVCGVIWTKQLIVSVFEEMGYDKYLNLHTINGMYRDWWYDAINGSIKPEPRNILSDTKQAILDSLYHKTPNGTQIDNI